MPKKSTYNERCGIYRITNLLNGKCYIGQTHLLFRERFVAHRSDLRRNAHDSPHLQAAWNLYGPEAFDFSHILTCPVEDLNRHEVEQMALVPPDLLYNVGKGGESPMRGIPNRRETKVKQSRRQNVRPFIAEHVETGAKQRYEFISEAAGSGFRSSCVSECLRGKRATHAKHVFYFEYGHRAAERAANEKARKPAFRPVVGTDVETGVSRTFHKVSAVEQAGFSASSVRRCLEGRQTDHRSHTWRYVDGKPARASAQTGRLGRNSRSRSVTATHLATGTTTDFEYIYQAAKQLGINESAIYGVLKGICAQASGYFFVEKKQAP